ncbi:hypothetical protein GMD78_09190 [Ornithinibacillus sp. L9]|uniref:Glyoxalase n=1 Tax=Ornithinibacillus caprae TaxID=2678566 RepID=A0A6N8FGG0_9BACI|nr:VOC family protein [Ornithinibacillus caprae]MUK88563.1 hypothetical protein [Ornithinibacillus caprae]
MTQANKVSVTGIACINLPVTNVTVSKDWYVKNFGCQVLRDMERGNEWANEM